MTNDSLSLFVISFLGFILGVGLSATFFMWKMRSHRLELSLISSELSLFKNAQVQEKDSQKQMAEQFELLAHRLLDEKSKQISETQTRSLSLVLDPLKERLKDFEKRVEETYGTERSERSVLRGEIGKLIELNAKMSVEAGNLTKALKGDIKSQGNWGEMILENILERSGLRKNEEYTVQGGETPLKNQAGSNIRPDVIISLPEGRHLIVDSKVSLVAYEAYSQSQDTKEQEAWADKHVLSLRRHIEGLSQKKYESSEKLTTPDFVILFMPIEPAFAVAMRKDPLLLQFAWERNIALVSPTTLLTTLKTVSSLWKQERQQRNALEIAKRGGALYDKFAAFATELEIVGQKIEAAQKSHQQAMSRLSEGPGNLVRQAELLKELGAKTDKKLQLSSGLDRDPTTDQFS